MYLPTRIQPYVAGKKVTENHIGMTSSTILETEDIVIKIEDYHNESKREYEVLPWLQQKIPVPQLIEYLVEDNISYIVMEKLSGIMAMDEYYTSHPTKLIKILSEAIKTLWSIPVESCPIWNLVDTKLQEAKHRIDHNLIVESEIDYTYLNQFDINTPIELLNWLTLHKPQEDIVFTHGDLCLPNIIYQNHKLEGFIDLGRAGLADRYQDIALCVRSMTYNLQIPYEDPLFSKFFEELNISPDWEKIHYYILLDELF